MDFSEIVDDLALVAAIAILLNIIAKVIVDKIKLPRLFWWTAILLPFALTHFYLINFPVFARMVGLCVVLLLGMKIIIYSEWRRDGGRVLSMSRWLMFSFLWFGMDPKAWVGRRRQLEWKSHLKLGALCLVGGASLLTMLVYVNIEYILLLFVAMSMMFHFGILRILTALWRKVGYPVRTLFRNPCATSGFADFWGKRWNLAYSFMMARAVQRPLRSRVGEKGSVFAVFVVSGIFHEFAITVPAQSGYGLPFLFFLIHGFFTVIERKNLWWSRWLCLSLLVVGVPILFPSVFQEEVFNLVVEQWKQWTKI